MPDRSLLATRTAADDTPATCYCGEVPDVDGGCDRHGRLFWQIICPTCGRSGARCSTESAALESWADDQFAIKDFNA